VPAPTNPRYGSRLKVLHARSGENAR
jgi:hypothetical protein